MKTRQEPYCDVYIGTAAELVEAGIAELSQLPGQPGNGKTTTTFIDGKPKGRGSSGCRNGPGYMQIQKLSGERFLVCVGIPDEVAAARRGVLHEQHRQRQEAQHAASLERAKSRNCAWPWPPGHFGVVLPYEVWEHKANYRDMQRLMRRIDQEGLS